METLMEHVYNNIYKEHMMAYPILGEIENIHAVNREMVVDFYLTNYYGENMVIVGTGEVDHEQLVDLAEKHFGSIPRISDRPRKNTR